MRHYAAMPLPNFAASTHRFVIFGEQVIDRQGCRGPERRKSAAVPTKSILGAANMPIIGGHHLLALQSSPEGWQAPSRYWNVV
jgi:hypothetical protein